jgi:hypothetical protein
MLAKIVFYLTDILYIKISVNLMQFGFKQHNINTLILFPKIISPLSLINRRELISQN